MGSQNELMAMATNMQLFSQQEDRSRKRIHYEPNSIVVIKPDFYPKVRHFEEVDILKLQ